MRTDDEKTRRNRITLMHSAFENGDILNASEETLQEYLSLLCTEGVINDNVRHREVIRALTINHIQMQRHIDKLNRQNTLLQWLVILLAILSFIATGYQIYIQTQKTTVPLRQEKPYTPSVVSETKASIPKISKETPGASKNKNTNKKATPLESYSKSKPYGKPQ